MRRLFQWIDERIPVSRFVKHHLSDYRAPKNFNIWYYFGSLAILVFASQIISGIFLLMHYVPSKRLLLIQLNSSCVMFLLVGLFVTFMLWVHHCSLWWCTYICTVLLCMAPIKPRELLWLLGAFYFYC